MNQILTGIIPSRMEHPTGPVEYALSIRQPWAWAVAYGHKCIENRTWRPRKNLGNWIAIHAGLIVEMPAISIVRDMVEEEPVIDRGAIVGVALLVDVICSDTQENCLPEDQLKWFSGPYGLIFQHARPLRTPLPCRGHQSIWHLSENVTAALQTSLRDA